MKQSEIGAVPPVLLIAFRRPELLQRVIEGLRIVRPARVYLAVDGPRRNADGDSEACASTRELAATLDWGCEVKTLFREENVGCARGVSEAISWFFETEEFGIILEEDCLADPTFFTFAAELGCRYANDERVGMIGGFAPFRKNLDRASSYVFVSQPMCWGWATWRRAWMNFDLLRGDSFDSSTLSRTLSKAYLPDLRAVEYWTRQVRSASLRKIDTWDYQWLYALAKVGQLCVVPTHSLTINMGFAPRATNTAHERTWVRSIQSAPIVFPLVHPPVALDLEAQTIINRQYFRVRRYTSMWYSAYRRLVQFRNRFFLGER